MVRSMRSCPIGASMCAIRRALAELRLAATPVDEAGGVRSGAGGGASGPSAAIAAAAASEPSRPRGPLVFRMPRLAAGSAPRRLLRPALGLLLRPVARRRFRRISGRLRQLLLQRSVLHLQRSVLHLQRRDSSLGPADERDEAALSPPMSFAVPRVIALSGCDPHARHLVTFSFERAGSPRELKCVYASGPRFPANEATLVACGDGVRGGDVVTAREVELGIALGDTATATVTLKETGSCTADGGPDATFDASPSDAAPDVVDASPACTPATCVPSGACATATALRSAARARRRPQARHARSGSARPATRATQRATAWWGFPSRSTTAIPAPSTGAIRSSACSTTPPLRAPSATTLRSATVARSATAPARAPAARLRRSRTTTPAPTTRATRSLGSRTRRARPAIRSARTSTPATASRPARAPPCARPGRLRRSTTRTSAPSTHARPRSG